MKNHIKKAILFILLSVGSFYSLSAQTDFDKWEFKAFAGYNLGGTLPMPLPAEIRKVNSWSPGLNGTLAIHVTRWLTPQWGITSGLAIDLKGMKTNADVKYWQMNLQVGEGDATGFFTGIFTGNNVTKVRNGYIVLPFMAAWHPLEKWTFRLGGYVASLQDATFEGTASDGYIRSGGPAGERINVGTASFDFSDELRKFDAGLMASADWWFSQEMAVTGQFSLGLVPVFPGSFEGIAYKMRNLYFMVGIAYKL